MQPLPNTNGFDSESTESSETDSPEQASSGGQSYKSLIHRANSISLKTLFKAYGVNIEESGKNNVICPFPKHQGRNRGQREASPSLYFYPNTNSFWCFGCKVGTKATNFVAAMDNSTYIDAAYKIIDHFEAALDGSVTYIPGIDYGERLEILMDFSNCLRDFMQDHVEDPYAIVHAENLTSIFDRHYTKRTLDNKALQLVISKLKDKVNTYTCPQY